MLKQLTLQRPALAKQNRVAIFVDAANLFYAAQSLGIHIDYQKLKAYFAGDFSLMSAWFYTGVDSTNAKQLGFLSKLEELGYEIIADELVQRRDGSQKANLDVKIGLDMADYVDSYDTAILIGGDGDLKWAVERVQNLGKRVEVVALASMTSHALRKLADRYIDLADIQEHIRKMPYRQAA